MSNFSTDQYSMIIGEIRERIFSADVLSAEKNLVFIESTSLQIRKILELIAYLSVLVNSEKLNHKNKNEWHPKKIIENLEKVTPIFYPFPSHIFFPSNEQESVNIIPFGYGAALNKEEFVAAYKTCGDNLHAQHPLKKRKDVNRFFIENQMLLRKIKDLLQNHTIGVRINSNNYTFIYVEIDFTKVENTHLTIIREFNVNIHNEDKLKTLFTTLNIYDVKL